jgi:hypothetical protein
MTQASTRSRASWRLVRNLKVMRTAPLTSRRRKPSGSSNGWRAATSSTLALVGSDGVRQVEHGRRFPLDRHALPQPLEGERHSPVGRRYSSRLWLEPSAGLFGSVLRIGETECLTTSERRRADSCVAATTGPEHYPAIATAAASLSRATAQEICRPVSLNANVDTRAMMQIRSIAQTLAGTVSHTLD